MNPALIKNFALTLLFVTSVTSGCVAHASSKTQMVQQNGTVKVGEKLPTFGGWTTDGKRTALTTLLKGLKGSQGHLVLSVFSSTCKPCRKGLPMLQKFADSPQGKNNVVALIAYGETAAEVNGFLKKLKVSLLVIEDKYTKISENIGVDGVLPRTYIIDAQGIVKAIITEEGNDFVAVLKKLTQKPG